MKFLAKIVALIVITFIVAPVAQMFDVGFLSTLGGVVVTSFLTGLVQPAGVAMVSLIPDLWTGELLKAFRNKGTFLERIPKKNEYVKANTIKMAEVGVDPEVLVNNTTYPIESTQREDGVITLDLDKFDTKNTDITDDELHGLPYDKPGSVVESHRLALEEKTEEKAIHSLCPDSDTSTTPIVKTTGDSNEETDARKRLIIADLIKAKRKLDDLKVPKKGRELVLCPSHVEDLLLVSQVYKDQYSKLASGEVINLYGFIISEFSGNPNFSATTNAKKAFGAASNPSDDLDVSPFYYAPRAVQAVGTVTLYHGKAVDRPETRKSTVGFRLYHLCLPKQTTGFGAIVSTKVA